VKRKLVLFITCISIIMLLVLGYVIFSKSITEEEMIVMMNTSENVQLMSKAIDNPMLLISSPYSQLLMIYAIQLQNKSEFAIKIENGSTYRFAKYKGLYNCSRASDVNCSNLTTISVERQKIRLFYYSSNILKQTVLRRLEDQNKNR
jgi:hypothetical protein